MLLHLWNDWKIPCNRLRCLHSVDFEYDRLCMSTLLLLLLLWKWTPSRIEKRNRKEKQTIICARGSSKMKIIMFYFFLHFISDCNETISQFCFATWKNLWKEKVYDKCRIMWCHWSGGTTSFWILFSNLNFDKHYFHSACFFCCCCCCLVVADFCFQLFSFVKLCVFFSCVALFAIDCFFFVTKSNYCCWCCSFSLSLSCTHIHWNDY